MASTDVRRRLSVEDRRAELIELGVEIFSQHAYDEISNEALAARAGISRSLLYHYFRDKRDFYLATIREMAQRLVDATSPDPELSFELALRSSLERFVQFVSENPAIYQAIVHGGIGSDKEMEAMLERVRRVSLDRVQDILGVANPPPALRILLYGWIGFTETAALEWSKARDLPADELVDMLTQTLTSRLPAHLIASNHR
jgi:AcrR family transcriptional regulator